MDDRLNNATQLVETLMKSFVVEGQTCLDATAGNGMDTVTLANLVGDCGLVYSFDIQKEAIKNTEELLIRKNLRHRVNLIEDSHVDIQEYIGHKIDFVVYNLGYLPGGDKAIRTDSSTTSKSIKNALEIMAPGAIMLITSYRGHEGGLLEYEAVKKITEGLDQKKYNVFEFKFINQKNNPPVTIGVEVRGGKTWQR
ncbi:tRNA (mnm(5)s(2)U34)-methyltransferase [Gudongella sp. DL1XJH-153]|uniref:tRNA (mnm(5)s(2)U34)-methyltransferase n=1 Tax=Gudongella sp. DL1XJH-153 TaxID=3409804 RepID=UPI003BB4EA3C